MPLQQFTDAELHDKAVQLGLIADGDDLPRHMRSRVAAAIVEERRAAAPQKEQPAQPVRARQITVRGTEITVDGKPFPWLVAAEPMEIGLSPDGSGTVRLTLVTDSVQILKPNPDSSESE